MWFACCFLCIAFVYFFIYETKGLSLEEIDQMYTAGVPARKSAQWTPGQPPAAANAVVVAGAKDGQSSGEDIELVAAPRPLFVV